jgi:DNA-binding NarL/FixJ family response regulator
MNTSVTSATKTLSVIVVDDHTTFSDLLAMALNHEPDLVCLGTAASVAKALLMVDELRPDLVVMDVQLGDGDGIAATAELMRLYPDLRVVVLTAHIDGALIERAADAGACCLLPKDGSLPEVLAALRSSRRGGLIVHPALLKAFDTSRSRRRSDCLPPMTRRERDVLRMLAEGLDAAVISRNLGISLHTCRGYLRSLLTKLGAHSQLEAVVIAANYGLVTVGPGIPLGVGDRRKER